MITEKNFNQPKTVWKKGKSYLGNIILYSGKILLFILKILG